MAKIIDDCAKNSYDMTSKKFSNNNYPIYLYLNYLYLYISYNKSEQLKMKVVVIKITILYNI